MLRLFLLAAAAAAAQGTSSASTSLSAATLGIILFAREDVEIEQYTPLTEAILAAVSDDIAIATVSTLAEAETALTSTLNSTTSLLVAGHGMTGGAEAASSGQLAQAFALSSARGEDSPPVSGLVLLNGFLTRNQRPGLRECIAKKDVQPKASLRCPLGCLDDGAHDCSAANSVSYDLPVLTVAGELDGIVRIARQAEAFTTQVQQSTGRETDVFAVVEGMSHASLLQDEINALPVELRSVDIKAERSGDDVRAETAGLIAAFAGVLASNGETEARVQAEATTTLAAANSAAAAYYAPLLEAFMVQEGNWFFLGGTDDEHSSVGGSAFGAAAQQMMASPLPDGYSWTPSPKNEFHLVSDEDKIPPYYRDQHRASVEMSSDNIKLLQSSTVSQLRFIEKSVLQTKAGLDGYAIIEEEKLNILDLNLASGDNGTDFVSAIEIATKMRSRQWVFNYTNQANTSEALDDGDRCADINQASWDLAWDLASATARDRFIAGGMTVTMEPDLLPGPPAAGPWWIWSYLQFERDTSALELHITSYKAFYALSAGDYGKGNHYCKILSPARAMEWIYTDGLR